MIGIVGGVGPLAGLDIVGKIIAETKANKDQDHLPVLLSSQPHRITDRTQYLLGAEPINPAYAIAAIIQELERGGSSVVGIPCNTAHSPRILSVVMDELQKAKSNIKVLHLVEETAQFIVTNYGKIKVGILSTTGTKNTGLYKKTLALFGLEAIEPDEHWQEKVHATIYDEQFGIKAVSSPVTNRVRQDLIAAIGQLKSQGAQAIILGCTELPLALPEKETAGLTLIDPNRILARALIREIDAQKLLPLSV
mgnify:CR=1 FL=1